MQNCDMCTKFQTQKVDPMRGTPFPNKPWGKVAAEFLHKGHSYLFVVDYYSRDVEICLVSISVKTAENIDSANEGSVGFCGRGTCDSLITALNLHPNNEGGIFKEFECVILIFGGQKPCTRII